MDEPTMARVLSWEAEAISFDDTMQMVSTLVKDGNLWVLKGNAGRIACVALMKELFDGKH